MSPEEHKAEAERLLAIARKPIMSGAPIGFDTHQDVVALAQVHATLALYRPPTRPQLGDTGEMVTLLRRMTDAKRIFDGGGR